MSPTTSSIVSPTTPDPTSSASPPVASPVSDIYTPVERRILGLLSDSLPHSREELGRCLSDDLSNDVPRAVRWHVFNLRRKLRDRGEYIVLELVGGRRMCYRHVRLLASPYDGKR
jgi:DNA-binding CsgD family transcriptional regulator